MIVDLDAGYTDSSNQEGCIAQIECPAAQFTYALARPFEPLLWVFGARGVLRMFSSRSVVSPWTSILPRLEIGSDMVL